MPTPPRHDAELEARLTAVTADHPRPAAAVVVDADGMAGAWVGAGIEADYEIGSVSKGVTGLLYRDAVDRGEVTPDTTLGQLLVRPESTVAGVGLGALATHRSGLPRLPPAAKPLRRTLTLFRRGTNPYGETLPELLQQADTVRPGPTRPRYSNFGFELLGHAVAAGAGTRYADLVAARLAGPLGLTTMYVAVTPADLRPAALIGSDRGGRPREPWTGEALGPAGGIRASITDLGHLLTALVDGSAPGIGALDPVAPLGRKARIGAGWVTIDVDGVPITWHNGGTGGFRSWVGVDRGQRRGAAVLSATTRSVDRFGFDLLTNAR